MNPFNIRVYGLLCHEGKILLSHERRNGCSFTKFPGGGLEKGEGLSACVQREFMEELGIAVAVDRLFYVNDHFVQSAFDKDQQIISFYYLVETQHLADIVSTARPINPTADYELQEWYPIQGLNRSIFTFPIDQLVSERLQQEKQL